MIAKKIIQPISIQAALIEAGGKKNIDQAIEEALKAKDSIGGIIECCATNMPIGLGEPFFESLESQIEKIQQQELKSDISGKANQTVGPIQSFSQKTSTSFIDFFEDLFNKDTNISWSKHLNEILLKNDRIFYLGNLLILIALYYLLIKYLK